MKKPVRQRGQWPPPVSDPDKAAWDANHPLEQKRLEGVLAAEIELAKEERLALLKSQDLDLATSDHLERTLHEKLLDEASSGVARIIDNAKYVQTIAAALAGLYATALGITFAVATSPLPARGFIAPLFFGLAMVQTAFYLAFLGSSEGPRRPVYAPSAAENNWKRSIYFAEYAVTIAYRRRGWLRAAILALFVGVIFMPAPFLEAASTVPAPAVAAERAEAATAALPAPPEGNRVAEARWYEEVLAAYEAAGEPSEATVQPFWIENGAPISFDSALALLAAALYVALLALSGLLSVVSQFSRAKPVSTPETDSSEAGQGGLDNGDQ